jgi:hypothetical protein
MVHFTPHTVEEKTLVLGLHAAVAELRMDTAGITVASRPSASCLGTWYHMFGHILWGHSLKFRPEKPGRYL